MFNLPYNENLKPYARQLRKAGNLAEVLLWKQIKNRQIHGLDFDRQRIIGNYIVDFYCPKHGVVIEIDGGSHNNKIDEDENRDEYLKSLGLKVIRFLDSEVLKNLAGVIEFLLDYFKQPTF